MTFLFAWSNPSIQRNDLPQTGLIRVEPEDFLDSTETPGNALWTVAGYQNDKVDLLFEFINPIRLILVEGITGVAKMLGICFLALDKRFIM
jgi:hypothetical protein